MREFKARYKGDNNLYDFEWEGDDTLRVFNFYGHDVSTQDETQFEIVQIEYITADTQ